MPRNISFGTGSDLRHPRHTPIARHGHSGQAYCTSLALAERLCRTADRIDPGRVCGTFVVLGEAHLRRVLRAYTRYYNDIRTDRSLDKDAPVSRPIQRTGSIGSRSILGGLHHHYVRGWVFGTDNLVSVCAKVLVQRLDFDRDQVTARDAALVWEMGFACPQIEEAFMRMSAPLVALISSLGITAIALAADDPLMKQAQGLFQPIPLEPPAVKGVTSTPAMVELGTDLYFDPRLSQPQH
jgi:hypothetical protein